MKLTRVADAGLTVNPHVFTYGDGTWSYFRDEAVYADRTTAARAWSKCRPLVWRMTRRFQIPGAAGTYDGLTAFGVEFVQRSWNHVGRFDLEGALAALAEDRANLETFASTKAARPIDDDLELFRRDLATVEETARDLASVPADAWLRRQYPAHLNTATVYGGAEQEAR